MENTLCVLKLSSAYFTVRWATLLTKLENLKLIYFAYFYLIISYETVVMFF
jgi:hypothetical protein